MNMLKGLTLYDENRRKLGYPILEFARIEFARTSVKLTFRIYRKVEIIYYRFAWMKTMHSFGSSLRALGGDEVTLTLQIRIIK